MNQQHPDKEQTKQAAAVLLQKHGPLTSARHLAETLFEGITEIDGSPYFGHLERVAAGIPQENIKPIGYLHDLIEDIEGWEFQDLTEIGFDQFITDGVRAVTKNNDPYFDKIVALSMVPQAIPVKKSDLRDNSNMLRLPRLPTADDIERTRKYYLSWHYLNDVESGSIRPGTPFAQWMMIQPAAKRDYDLLRKYTAADGGATLKAALANEP